MPLPHGVPTRKHGHTITRLRRYSGSGRSSSTRLSQTSSCGWKTTSEASANGSPKSRRWSAETVRHSPVAITRALGEVQSLVRFILAVTLGATLAVAGYAQTIPPIEANATPLHWAAEHGLTDIVVRLIANGASVSAPDAFGRTPLHLAVPFTDVVEILLSSGADINATDVFSRTPLHDALQYPSTVRILLDNGADISAMDFLGDTALERTLRYGTRNRNLVVINLLLDAGAGA
ncbi:MAG: ankyrin repeat domain-containing protein, partial [Spirochaetales bacterium]